VVEEGLEITLQVRPAQLSTQVVDEVVGPPVEAIIQKRGIPIMAGAGDRGVGAVGLLLTA
jgi:hypothetical protein